MLIGRIDLICDDCCAAPPWPELDNLASEDLLPKSTQATLAEYFEKLRSTIARKLCGARDRAGTCCLGLFGAGRAAEAAIYSICLAGMRMRVGKLLCCALFASRSLN